MSIAELIESTPGVCGGKARISGTRIPVHRIALFYQLGYAPEEIINLLPSVTFSQIFAALAHALINPSEIEAALAEEEAVALELSPQQARTFRLVNRTSIKS